MALPGDGINCLKIHKHQSIRSETMSELNAVVGIFSAHTEAEASIKELQRSGFDMKKLSIVGKDYHTEEHVVGYYNVGDRMKFWGKQGAFWGGLWGLLFGSALFVVPGIGPLFVFGPLVGWLVGALEGSVVIGGLSALAAALTSIGIPKNSSILYETALKSDKFLVIVHGTADEVAKAKGILDTAGATQADVHPGIRGEFTA
jgi:uncharacterized membrane protein